MPSVIAKLVSITGCLSFPSQCPTVIHFDNCHTANQVMWKSITTDWLLHQPGWTGDGSASAGSWSPTPCVSLPTHAKLGTRSLPSPTSKGCTWAGSSAEAQWFLTQTFAFQESFEDNDAQPVPHSSQISITWQIKDKLLADKRKTYLLNNSPD